MVLARVGVPLGVEDGVEREGRVSLHDVGELEAGREQRVGEGPPALGAVARAVVLLPAPVLRDALTAEVVLAAETHWVLVDAQADGTQKLVLQTTRHLHERGDARNGDARRENREPGDPEIYRICVRFPLLCLQLEGNSSELLRIDPLVVLIVNIQTKGENAKTFRSDATGRKYLINSINI